MCHSPLVLQKFLQLQAVNTKRYLLLTLLIVVKQADLIYVLEDGKVVQSGTHSHLVKEIGLYQTLYGDLQDRKN